MTQTSPVVATPAAQSDEAARHFCAKLTFETDCWDTHYSLSNNATDFVLLDVRGPDLHRQGHVPGALNLPHGKMTERRMSEWDDETLFVVYCAGPHCNGADKAAVRLARMARPVKLMIGGATGWSDEGFEFAKGDATSTVQEVEQDANA